MSPFHLLTLILYFDGSLRLPPDPNLNIIPNSINSSSSILPLASCACAIFTKDNDIDTINSHSSILALKGKALQERSLSSADVEYEGLLLVLKEIQIHFEERLHSPVDVSNEIIIIKGDCKTVIDQMNGNSLPRKQRPYYIEARDIMNQIENEYQVSLMFEHVSRNKNELCDYMCFKINELIQWKYAMELNTTLATITKESLAREVSREMPSSKKRRLNSKETPFAYLIESLSSWDSPSHIPLSIRPYWLCEIFFHAEDLRDFVAVRLVGEALMNVAKKWKKVVGGLDHECAHMEMLGYRLILSSLEQMKLYKEADKIDKNILSSSYYSMGEDDKLPTLKHDMETLQKDILPTWDKPPEIPEHDFQHKNKFISDWYILLKEEHL